MVSLRTPSLLLAGENALDGLASLAEGHQTAAVVTDAGVRRAGLAALVEERLAAAGLRVERLEDVPAEPTIGQAESVVRQFQGIKADLIVAVGGGSVMDVAKLCSVLRWEGQTVRELMEQPASGRKQVYSVMIPTTAGTGSEATPNSIVTLPEEQLKVGIVCPALMPDAVVLDPRMIRSLPQSVAAASGVDALAHAVECFTSAKATPLSDLYALEALRLIVPSILDACLHREPKAQEAMLLGAYYAGVAITGSGTTAVHALSYPLGGRFHVPHGIANAILLAPVMRFNRPCCQERLARVSDMLWPDQRESGVEEKALRFLQELEHVTEALAIPKNYAAYGVGPEHLEELVRAGMKVTRLLNNNLRPVTEADARALYREVLEA